MTARASVAPGRNQRRGPGPRTASVAILAIVLAISLVVLAATDLKIGLEALVGLCFLPLCFARPAAAMCVWVVLAFFSRVSGIASVPDHLAILLLLCWLGLVAGRRENVSETIAHNRPVIACAVLFLAWELITLAWAPNLSFATQPIKDLIYAGLTLFVVLALVTERRHARWLALAFVAGATLTVLYGAARGGLHQSGASTVTDPDGRLIAGMGDPNYLAAVLVPAIMLALGLWFGRPIWQRVGLGFAMAVCAIGLAATQSRGGLIAAGVASAGALVIWREQRAAIAGLIFTAVVAIGGFFALSPHAFHRIYAGGGTGSGRTNLWEIAWRVIHSHPIFGVGLAQFPQVSPNYVRLPGSLTYVALIEDSNIAVHNVYLQLWAETGIIGLCLFLALLLVALWRTWVAGRLFELHDDREMVALARTALLALLGICSAAFFLSDDSNRQTWILFGLGTALLAIAAREGREAEALEVGWIDPESEPWQPPPSRPPLLVTAAHRD